MEIMGQEHAPCIAAWRCYVGNILQRSQLLVAINGNPPAHQRRNTMQQRYVKLTTYMHVLIWAVYPTQTLRELEGVFLCMQLM